MKEFWRYALEDGKINEYKCTIAGGGFYYESKNGKLVRHTSGELSRIKFGNVTSLYTLYSEKQLSVELVTAMFRIPVMKKFWKQVDELEKTIALAKQLGVLKEDEHECTG